MRRSNTFTELEEEFEIDPELLELESDFEFENEASRMSAQYVKWIQSSLNHILNLTLRVDGIPGSQTRSAIRSFQQRQGLKADGIVGSNTEAALIQSGAPKPPGRTSTSVAVPSPVVASARPVAGSLRNNLVRIALQESSRWGSGSKKESHPDMQVILKDYWVSGTGSAYGYNNKRAWSSAFISWVVRKAGGGTNFQYSGAHTTYTYYAKQNRLQNNSNPFKAYRITEKKPEPGDIIVQNRDNSSFTYDNVQPDKPGTHGDIVLKVDGNKVEVIGGNVKNSVFKRSYKLDANGVLNSSTHFAIIKIEEFGSGDKLSNEEFELSPEFLELETDFEWEGEVSRSSPEYVKWVQASLNKVLRINLGVDGVLGSKTRSAIRSFQQKQSLNSDGIVGPATEDALVKAGATRPPQIANVGSPYSPPVNSKPDTSNSLGILSPSELKAVRITSTFETGRPGSFGGLTGNFDGQGLSFGLLNFTIKAGSLIPLLQEFINKHPARYATIFKSDAQRFRDMIFATVPSPKNPKIRVRDIDRQMQFVNTEMNQVPGKAKGNRIIEPWKTYFSGLENDPEFRKIQVKAVCKAIAQARRWFNYFGFKTERGFAFMFDLVSSHGAAWLDAKKFKGQRVALLQQMIQANKTKLNRALTELETMEVIANMIADVSLKEWREKVRIRKLWFVNGVGKVHGTLFDIRKDFGITDNVPDFGSSGSGAC